MDIEKPQGYNEGEQLEIKKPETPRVMVDRLLSKTGPVAQTITEYCNQAGLAADNPKRIMLELGGVFLAAVGRRSVRKFPDSDPKELIKFEWESAFKAYNFVSGVLRVLDCMNDYYTQAGEMVRPAWRDEKPRVVKRLLVLGINKIDDAEKIGLARKQIMLEDYSFLEKRMTMIAEMIGQGCKKFGVTFEARRELTDKIMQKHYPKLPDYDENRFPLAYEVRVLYLWRKMNKE